MKNLNQFYVILLILAVVLVFLGNNIVMPAINTYPQVGTNDMTDYNYPNRYFLSQSLKKGQLPLWASLESSGYPLFAEGQIGALYPLNFIFAFLPTLISINLTLISSYFLIFLFTYLYLKKIGLKTISAFFGSILASFGGFNATMLLHPNALISVYHFIFELFLIEVLIQKKGKGLIWPILMGISLGLSFLGGHPQITFYSLMLIGAYWLIFWIIKKYPVWKLVFFGLLMILIGLGIGAVQILPTAEFTAFSNRAGGLTEAADSVDRFPFRFSRLITFVSPFALLDPEINEQAFVKNGWPSDDMYVYMGIIGLGFVLLSFFLIRRFSYYGYFFLGAGILGLVAAFSTQLTFGYIFNIPPFSFFRIPARSLFIVNFSLAVLAGLAFNDLLNWVTRKKYHPTLVQTIVILIVISSFIDLKINNSRLHPEVDANAWYKTPQVVSFLKKNLEEGDRVTSQFYYPASLKIYLENPDLWFNNQTLINLRNLLPVNNNFLYGIPFNVGAANSAGIKLPRYTTLESLIFYDGLKYRQNPKFSKLEAQVEKEGSSSAALKELQETPPTFAEPTDFFMSLNRLMGVRYVLSTQRLQNEILSKVFETSFKTGQDQVYVYEFFDYYTRFFLVPRAEKAEPDKILQHLVKGDFNLKDKVFLEEDPGDWGNKGGFASAIELKKYEDQYIAIETECASDGYLFLSDTYYPGWQAYVDGKKTHIYLANYAFRAIKIPQGKHKVEFKYQPESFWWGSRITAATSLAVVLAILGLLVLKKKGKKDKLN